MPLQLPTSLLFPVEVTWENCQKLTEAVSSVVGKPIQLLSSGQGGFTDGVNIYVPMDEYAYLVTGHELSHILFLSDLELRHVFCTDWGTDKLWELQRVGTSAYKGSLVQLMLDVTNLLDDLRVASWWATVWPGDARLLFQRWEDAAAQMQSHGVQLLARWCMGLPVAALDLERYPNTISRAQAAATSMWVAPFVEVLKHAAWVVNAGIDEGLLSVKQPWHLGQEDLRLKDSDKEKLDSRKKGKAARSATRAILATVQGDKNSAKYRSLMEDDLEVLQSVANDLRSLTTPVPTRDQALQVGNTEFRTVLRRQTVRRCLPAGVLREAERWKKRLGYGRTTRRSSPCEEGEELDTSLMTEGTDQRDYYRRIHRTPSFHVLLLIDGSSSMRGERFESVAIAATFLKEVVKGPHTTGAVWVYNSEGLVCPIYRLRLQDDLPRSEWDGTGEDDCIIHGGTPSGTAFEVAAKEIESRPGRRLLLHCTDGEPTDHEGAARILRKTEDLRRQGVTVLTVFTGGVTEQGMEKMSPPGTYAFVGEDGITDALTHLVIEQVLQRRR